MSTKKNHHLTYAEAHRLFEYEPVSGLLIRKVRTANCIKAGDVAGSLSNSGYLRVNVDGKLYQVHRIAFLLQTGAFPDHDTDHINGIRSDNRWSNLRAATRAENGRNQKKHADNNSGFKGVTFHKKTQKWAAQITLHGTNYHLGLYTVPEDAAQAYNGAAAIVFGEWQRKEER